MLNPCDCPWNKDISDFDKAVLASRKSTKRQDTPKELTDMAASAERTNSKFYFLDLYPIDNGLPIAVSNKIGDLITKHSPFDSGFDLPSPAGEIIVPGHTSVRLKLGVRATVTDETQRRLPFWLAPRSSISKTPLILANSMGIIDSGYNGELQAAFYNTSEQPYIIQQLDRLVQICSGDLTPFTKIQLNPAGSKPSETDRGEGGFGSTGK